MQESVIIWTGVCGSVLIIKVKGELIMAKIYTSTWDLIGNTPLMEVTQISISINVLILLHETGPICDVSL